jgi:excisionase family DNA binding protein
MSTSTAEAWPRRAAAPARYYTVSQAAQALQVHRTTVTRWIKDGRLPAYRVGPKAVRIKESDLQRVITSANDPGKEATGMQERESVDHTAVRDLPVKPLTEEEKERALATIARINEFRERLRREVGTFPPSEDIIREEREKRSKQPADL